MSEIDQLFNKFGGVTESYKFYNDEVELRYDPAAHVYLLVQDGELVPQDGVTTICHIIDKSSALIPWGCKMMAAKLLATVPVSVLPTGERVVPQLAYGDFEKLVLEAKNAHKEKLEEAADVGKQAHNWIEQYIKSVLSGNDSRKFELLATFPEDERARNCCLAALDWMQQHNVRWSYTERKIFSRDYGYAGTMDGLCLVDSCSDELCCPHPFKDRLSLADWKSSNYLYIEYLFQTAAYEHAHEEEFGVDITDRWVIRLGKDNGEFEPWHIEADQFEEDLNGFLECLYLSRTVDSVQERMKLKKDFIKGILKARAKQVKEEALKIRCKSADKYKGVRPPKCNGGNPCQSCLQKYAENQK